MYDAKIRLMEAGDLSQVLEWRNHPYVRSVMHSQQVICVDEHQKWFENSKKNPDRTLLIFEYEGLNSGFVQFNKTEKNGEVEWGFYLSPSAKKGVGYIMGFLALKYAFEKLKVDSVRGVVLASNRKSIRFHERLNFRQVNSAEQEDIGQPQETTDVIFILDNDFFKVDYV
ncbi:UDP-4-amino-4,6-dideoxy-N-acetyl-beta-L-altrosamine N-acetyltransferase [Gallaecimonas sp. GXIMD1310]|uniref:UDP-4-amino-4, 6-dideoxy-N-acetyl-beta-L-altrosamine N-acetyltransferase n=1 Tax=Gallaecimonas sp. GXIMD1310 TaxID=3131926 RepID=UPI00324428EB